MIALTYDKPIVEKVYLKNEQGKVGGSLFVKIYWDDIQITDRDLNEYNKVA